MIHMRSRVMAFVVAIAMLVSLMVPAFAAEEVMTGEEAAAFLNEVALLQGDENGDLMLDSNLTREQMMVIVSRLANAEADAESYPVEEMTFEDVPLESGYAPYIAWAQAEGITEGHSPAVFGFGEEMTAWQAKAFLVRALGYTDVADEDMAAKAEELGLTNGSEVVDEESIVRADMALLMYNTLYATTSNDTVLGEDLGVITVTPPAPAALEVASVKAVAENKVQVTFNRAVADTAAVKFEVKGAMSATFTPSWSEDKTVATLATTAVLLDGTYTVKVTGDTFAENKDTATFVVAKNGVAKIEILGDKLVRTGDRTGQVNVKLLDFYGNDVTQKMSYDVTLNSSRGTAAFKDIKKGLVEVTIAGGDTAWTNYPVTPELVSLTIYAKTAVNGTVASAYQALKVTELARVDKLELGKVVLPTSATKVLVNKVTAAYIEFTAVDQFGSEVTDLAKLQAAQSSEVFHSISDSAVSMTAEKYTDANGAEKLRYVVETQGLSDNRTVYVSVVSKYTGKTSNPLTLEVKKASAPEKVTLMAPEKIVAVGDTYTEGVVIPMVVVDQDGKQLSADEIVDNATAFQFSGDAHTDFAFKVASTGANKGKLVSTKNVVAAASLRTLIVTLSGSTTGGTANISVDVKEKAKARTLKLAQTPASNLLTNSVAKYSVDVLDQYGRVMEDDMLNAGAGTKVKVTLTGDYATATVNGAALTKDVASEVNASDVTPANRIVVTGGTQEGTSRVKVELMESTSVVDTLDTAFNVVKGIPSTLTFEAAAVPTLRALTDETDYTDDADVDANELSAAQKPYARAIELVGKDASGNTYAIPADAIVKIVSSDTKIVNAVLVGDVNIAAHDNKVVVWGAASATAFPAGDTATTKTANVVVTVGVSNGTKDVVVPVTVSKDDVKPAELVIIDKALDSTKPYSLPTDYKLVEEIAGESTNGSTTTEIVDTKFYIVMKDNFGVYSYAPVTSLKVTNLDKTSLRDVAVTTNANQSNITAGQFTTINTDKGEVVILMAGLGAQSTLLKVRVTDATNEDGDFVVPTATLPAATNATTNDADSLVVTFSDVLYINGTAVANGADVKTSFTVGGTTAGTTAITTAIYNSTAKTVTFTLANVDDADTLTHNSDATALTDAAGNKYAAKVYTYTAATTTWASN